MLKALLGSGRAKRLASDLCDAVSLRARSPVFFAGLGVPDTIDGRFDTVVLHAWLVLERLRELKMDDVSQAFVNLLFAGFDESLRELGVGDIGIGHRVKKMADAFYGRLSAYRASSEKGPLQDAIERNIFRGELGHDADAAILADYITVSQAHLSRCDLSHSAPDFGPLPVLAG